MIFTSLAFPIPKTPPEDGQAKKLPNKIEKKMAQRKRFRLKKSELFFLLRIFVLINFLSYILS
jgi:hypothetical protein